MKLIQKFRGRGRKRDMSLGKDVAVAKIKSAAQDGFCNLKRPRPVPGGGRGPTHRERLLTPR